MVSTILILDMNKDTKSLMIECEVDQTAYKSMLKVSFLKLLSYLG
jgi:hypothetical protein